MLARTHLLFGLFSALLVVPFLPENLQMAFVLLVGLGSLLPDVDHENSTINRACPVTRIFPRFFRHRGVFHSLFPVAIILAVSFWLEYSFVGLAISFGYLTHLLTDSLTRSGVNWLHPFSGWKLRGPFRTGGVPELLLSLALLAVTGFLAYRWLF